MVIASGSWRLAGGFVTDSESDERDIDDIDGPNRTFPRVVVIGRCGSYCLTTALAHSGQSTSERGTNDDGSDVISKTR